MEMMSDDPNMCHFVAGLQKDFKDCHLAYMYQGFHALSYMQHLQKGTFAGFQAMLFVSTFDCPLTLFFYVTVAGRTCRV